MAKDRGWQLHAAVGGVIGALAVLGIGREVVQHGWSLTAHQWLEALAWPVGGLAVVLVGLLAIAVVQWARGGEDQ